MSKAENEIKAFIYTELDRYFSDKSELLEEDYPTEAQYLTAHKDVDREYMEKFLALVYGEAELSN